MELDIWALSVDPFFLKKKLFLEHSSVLRFYRPLIQVDYRQKFQCYLPWDSSRALPQITLLDLRFLFPGQKNIQSTLILMPFGALVLVVHVNSTLLNRLQPNHLNWFGYLFTMRFLSSTSPNISSCSSSSFPLSRTKKIIQSTPHTRAFWGLPSTCTFYSSQ